MIVKHPADVCPVHGCHARRVDLDTYWPWCETTTYSGCGCCVVARYAGPATVATYCPSVATAAALAAEWAQRWQETPQRRPPKNQKSFQDAVVGGE